MNKPDSPVLRAEALTAGYPGVTALDDVSLDLAAGSVTALIGANGSGKSTLCAAIMGLVPLRAGILQIFGADPVTARKRHLISYVPQHEQIQLSFPVTVEQVVMMGRYRHMGFTRRARAHDKDQVDRALAQTQLTELRQRSIGELSGGQRKRTFIARALAQQTDLMVLDEPFAGVDRASEQLITEVLKGLSGQGVSVLVSTHHLQNLDSLADHAVLLQRRIIATGEPCQVLTEAHLAAAFSAGLEP